MISKFVSQILRTNNVLRLNQCFLQNIFIQIRKSPNPNFLKFIPQTPQKIMQTDKIHMLSRDDDNSPLAIKLFKIDGVTQIFYGEDHITIGKTNQCEWDTIVPIIHKIISDNFDKKIPIFTSEKQFYKDEQEQVAQADQTEIVKQIQEILYTKIRPVLQHDGGDLQFESFDEEKGIVHIQMRGACAGCPSSKITLKNGIERMLKFHFPQVKSVESTELSKEN